MGSAKDKISRYDYLILSFITIFFNYYWLQNIHYYVIDGSPLPTFINYFRDNTLYSNSFFVKSVEHYYTFYFYIAGYIGKFLSTESTISIMSLFPGLLIVPAVFLLGYILFSNKYVGYLTVLMTLTHWQGRVALGGADGFGNVVAHFAFAVPFLLLSYVLFLRRRFVLSFILASLTFNIHAPLALSFIFVLFVCILMNGEKRIQRLALMAGIFIVCASPTIFWYLRSILDSSTSETSMLDDWAHLNRLRNVHSLPFAWNIGVYIRFMAYAINLIFLVKLKNYLRRGIYKNLLGTVIAVFVLCLVGTIFVEFYDVKLITQLSLLRSTIFLVYMSAATLAAYFVAKIDEGSIKKPETVLAGLVIIALATWNIKIAILFEILLFGRLWFKYHMREYMIAFALILVLCVAGLYYVPQKYIYPPWDDLMALVLTISLIVLSSVFLVLYKEKRTWVFRIIFAISIVSLGLIGFYSSISDEQIEYLVAEKNAQEWLSKQTAKDERILIPPTLSMWENYSKRDTFLTFNHLAYAFYGTDLISGIMGYIEEYVPDMSDISNSDELRARMTAEYQSWDENKVRTLAAKYGIGYFVSDNGNSYEFPLVYQNSRFRIFKIERF